MTEIEPYESYVTPARQRIDRIKAHVTAAWSDIVEAYRQRDWITLGYRDWDQMCEVEFGGARIALPVAERQQVVADLRGEGLSTRAIASAVGVDDKTVRNDLGGAEISAPVIGQDGKTYPATKPRVEDKAPRRQAGQPGVPTIALPTHLGEMFDVAAPKGRPTFNSTNENVDWASWTWNPVTGCLHGCTYCYAREIANSERMKPYYPAGFTPLFHHERLDAPKHTSVPTGTNTRPQDGRVFVCSMADLFGEWVPQEWIDAVFDAALAAPEWEYLFLTKFPQRYRRINLPPKAWFGASVDTQKRVRTVEKAMPDLDVKVRWLSVEPMLEPLSFNDLSWCDLLVIGSQTATVQPEGPSPAVAPDFVWVMDLVGQARAAGVPVYLKPNLLGNVNSQSPGMVMPRESPRAR